MHHVAKTRDFDARLLPDPLKVCVCEGVVGGQVEVQHDHCRWVRAAEGVIERLSQIPRWLAWAGGQVAKETILGANKVNPLGEAQHSTRSTGPQDGCLTA
eukprot:290828-Prymnesium_polylepis.1